MARMRLSTFFPLGLLVDSCTGVSLWNPFKYIYLCISFDPWCEVELLLLTVDIELDFSSPKINVGVGRAQEMAAKDKRFLYIHFHIQD